MIRAWEAGQAGGGEETADSAGETATALAVGRKLAALAETRQVLWVTHLPQVAAFADTHYEYFGFVYPSETQGTAGIGVLLSYTLGVDECHPTTSSGKKRSFPSANSAAMARLIAIRWSS